MSGYYEVISRAVRNLENNTLEKRQRVYARAREAMRSHFGSEGSSTSKNDAEKRTSELERAISQVEGEQKSLNVGQLAGIALVESIPINGEGDVTKVEFVRPPETIVVPLQVTAAGDAYSLKGSDPEADKIGGGAVPSNILADQANKTPSAEDLGPYQANEIGSVISFSVEKREGLLAIDGKPDLKFSRGSFRGPNTKIVSGAEVEIEIAFGPVGIFAKKVTLVPSGGKASGDTAKPEKADGYEQTEVGIIKHHNYQRRYGHITIDGKTDLYFKTGAFEGPPIDIVAGLEVVVSVSKNHTGNFATSVRRKQAPLQLDETQKKEIENREAENLKSRIETCSPGALLERWSQIKVRLGRREDGSSVRDETAIPRLAELALGETWHFSYDTDEYSILRNYIRFTFYRLAREGKVAFSGDYATFNTGLVDKLYDPIYALFRANPQKRVPHQFIDYCVPGTEHTGKVLMEKFHDLPEPAQYMNSFEEVIFDPKCTITVQWPHVIFDAIEAGRYPLKFLERHRPASMNWANDPPMNNPQWLKRYVRALRLDDEQHRNVKYQIEKAIELAKKRAKWNYKTAIPSYYPAENEMSLLLPIALISDSKPDIALVVDKVNPKVYFGVTAFPLDMAYGNARLVCRPDSDWLSPDDVDERNLTGEPDED